MFHCSVIKDRFCIAVCLKQLCYYIMSFPACQELFSTFLKLFLFLSCSNFDILSHPTGCCQELFSFLFDSKNFNLFFDKNSISAFCTKHMYFYCIFCFHCSFCKQSNKAVPFPASHYTLLID